MHRRHLIAAALVLSVVLPSAAPAGAEPGAPLVIWAEQRSDASDTNLTVSITVWVYLGTGLEDPDDLNVTVQQPYNFSLVVVRLAQGIYVVHLSTPSVSRLGWYPNVVFNGTLGALNATRALRVYWGPAPEPAFDHWNIRVRGVDPFGGGSPAWWSGRRQVTEGQLVTVEARATLNGSLADPGAVVASIQCWDGFRFLSQSDAPSSPLAATRVAQGVFRTSLVAANPTNVTQKCVVEMIARNSPRPGETSSTGSSVSFAVVPFPVFVWQESLGPGNTTWRVLAGGSGPISGAQVTAHGGSAVGTNPLPNETVDTVLDQAVTDANGSAQLRVDVDAGAPAELWINVSAGGRTSSVELLGYQWFPDPAPLSFEEEPVSNSSFSASFESPWPAPVPFLGPANYTMRATSNGTPLPNETVFVYPYTLYEVGPFPPLRAVTDQNGSFSFAIQLNLSTWNGFKVLVVDVNHGEDSALATAPAFLQPFPWWDYLQSLPTDLSAMATGNRTSGGAFVRGQFEGNRSREDFGGWATLSPSDADQWCGGAYGAVLVGPIDWTGTAGGFEGRVPMPTWYPEGDYCLVVSVGNETWSATNYSIVHLGPAAPDPPAPPTPPPTPNTTVLSAFFDAGWYILAILVLAAAIVAAAARIRRRRDDDLEP